MDRIQRSLFRIVQRSFPTIPFYFRWTIVTSDLFSDRSRIVSEDPLCVSLNDRFERSRLQLVSSRFQGSLFWNFVWSFPTIPFYNHRWTIVSNDACLRSLNDRFQRCLFGIVGRSFPTNPFLKSLNECFNRSLSTIVERSFPSILVFDCLKRSYPTILVYDRWTIVYNDLFLGSLNYRFQLSRSTIVKWSFLTIISYGRWTIVSNDPF